MKHVVVTVAVSCAIAFSEFAQAEELEPPSGADLTRATIDAIWAENLPSAEVQVLKQIIADRRLPPDLLALLIQRAEENGISADSLDRLYRDAIAGRPLASQPGDYWLPVELHQLFDDPGRHSAVERGLPSSRASNTRAA